MIGGCGKSHYSEKRGHNCECDKNFCRSHHFLTLYLLVITFLELTRTPLQNLTIPVRYEQLYLLQCVKELTVSPVCISRYKTSVTNYKTLEIKGTINTPSFDQSTRDCSRLVIGNRLSPKL